MGRYRAGMSDVQAQLDAQLQAQLSNQLQVYLQNLLGGFGPIVVSYGIPAAIGVASAIGLALLLALLNTGMLCCLLCGRGYGRPRRGPPARGYASRGGVDDDDHDYDGGGEDVKSWGSIWEDALIPGQRGVQRGSSRRTRW